MIRTSRRPRRVLSTPAGRASLFIALSLMVVASTAAFAETEQEEQRRLSMEFEASLEYQYGEIELSGASARLNLDGNYKYLDASDTQRLLEQAWGNPPGAETLGAIVPFDFGVWDPSSWAVILSFDEDGYVSDEDAADIEYDELLLEMQGDTAAASEERVSRGYGAIELAGWADPPYYDAESHQLYWAKELIFEGSGQNTLNYSIRALGRRGVLILNAVATIDELAVVRDGMQGLLPLVEFDTGSRYVDFDPDVDTVAAYGIGALVAGKLAAKAGLLAKFAPLLLVFKKFGIVIVVGLGAFLKKVFSGRNEKYAGKPPPDVDPTDPSSQS